jgi:hypothetical protein
MLPPDSLVVTQSDRMCAILDRVQSIAASDSGQRS